MEMGFWIFRLFMPFITKSYRRTLEEVEKDKLENVTYEDDYEQDEAEVLADIATKFSDGVMLHIAKMTMDAKVDFLDRWVRECKMQDLEVAKTLKRNWLEPNEEADWI